MKYSVHGPFKIARHSGNVDRNPKVKREFWERVAKEDSCLPAGCGCYLFAVQAGRGIKPWYIGMAEKQSFENECFSSHKLNIYNDVLAKGTGTPIIFLIAKRTKKNKLAHPSKRRHPSSKFLESMLIGIALDRNTNLMNIHKTKFAKEMTVPGLINSPEGAPTRAESKFKKAMRGRS